MGAALMGVDVVGEGKNRLGVGAGPLHRQLEFGLFRAIDHLDDVGVNRLAVDIEVLDEVEQAAAGRGTSRPGRVAVFGWALVVENDLQTAIEIGHLAQTAGDGVVVELEWCR